MGLSEDALARFVARARQAAALHGTVDVLVTSSNAMRALNFRFRGFNKATDVLSFPADSITTPKHAGDIAISAEIAQQNARRLGHSGAEEIKILALHGILHLAGYDHETDRGEMARLEEQLCRKLRLPVALIERTVAPARETARTGAPKKRTLRSTHSPGSRVPAKRRPVQ